MQSEGSDFPDGIRATWLSSLGCEFREARQCYRKPIKNPGNDARVFGLRPIRSVLGVAAQLRFGSFGQVRRQEVLVRVVVGLEEVTQGFQVGRA
jgi:hypothetical protein